jgi:hypothetical protein
MIIARDHMISIITHHHLHNEGADGKGRAETLPGTVIGSGMIFNCVCVRYIVNHINIGVFKNNAPEFKGYSKNVS